MIGLLIPFLAVIVVGLLAVVINDALAQRLGGHR